MDSMYMKLKDAIRKLISEYASVYESVLSRGDWKNPFRDIVGKEIPDLLTECAEITSPYTVVGSYGKGRWTTVPWIAVFDTRITTSAQKGVYIVYLLNKDSKELYLTFEIAATEAMGQRTNAGGNAVFTGVVGNNNPQLKEKLMARADEIREAVPDDYFCTDDKINSGAAGYDSGAVYYKKYSLSDLPDGDVLTQDLLKMLDIYGRYYLWINKQQMHNAGVFDSWEIVDESTAIKTCDKSFFDYNGSGVPRGICWFFGAEALNIGEAKSITIRYQGSDYSGRVSNESSDRRRVRIFWNADLGQKFKEISNKEGLRATFKKISDNTYEIVVATDAIEQRKTWLLSWNPNNWNWEDYDEAVKKTHALKSYDSIWSCANTHVSIGDRVFLIMLGMGNSNGILASGIATSKSFEADHWDTQKQAQGIKAKRINVKFDWIIDYRKDEILNQNQLSEIFPGQQWSPQGSGIAIKEEYTEELETLWRAIRENADKLRGEEEMPVSTKEAIGQIKAYIAAKGFSYNNGLIENFFLSLKSKPFVILAGTSGTGKTRLVKLFAEAIGAEYQLVPVRPDWSDSSDLFGHVDLNQHFIPGPIIDFIKAAQDHPNKPYFLCLDEMNLARVEYYLSDILSVIETRDFVDGKIVSDALIGIDKYGADIKKRDLYGKIEFPQNLYLVGTVNMDETTFPFSKKVLDRANTIEFNYVDLIPTFDPTGEAPEKLQLPNSFLCSEYLLLSQCADQTDYVTGVCTELQSINLILQKANAHIGYRVRDEIVFYMLNNRNEGQLLSDDEAFDNAIMQKILPRIQGSSASIKDMLLELYKNCCGDYEQYSGDTDSEKMRKMLSDSSAVIKHRKCAEKLEMMVRRFEEDGFTSYWL